MHRKQHDPGSGTGLRRGLLVTALLLGGLASIVTAAFLVGPALGCLVLGIIGVGLAVLIHLSGGESDAD